METRAVIFVSSEGHVDTRKNRVLAVERAAPSKHNDSNNLFIEDSEPASTCLTLGKDFRTAKVNRV
jgi:hypothetical protein